MVCEHCKCTGNSTTHKELGAGEVQTLPQCQELATDWVVHTAASFECYYIIPGPGPLQVCLQLAANESACDCNFKLEGTTSCDHVYYEVKPRVTMSIYEIVVVVVAMLGDRGHGLRHQDCAVHQRHRPLPLPVSQRVIFLTMTVSCPSAEHAPDPVDLKTIWRAIANCQLIIIEQCHVSRLCALLQARGLVYGLHA